MSAQIERAWNVRAAIMKKSGPAYTINRRNFALFNSAGALVDWSEGFADEFAAAKAKALGID